MKKRDVTKAHDFWAVESSVWGILPYSIREKRFNAWRSVAVDYKTWKNFKKQGLYRLIRVRVKVTSDKNSSEKRNFKKPVDKTHFKDSYIHSFDIMNGNSTLCNMPYIMIDYGANGNNLKVIREVSIRGNNITCPDCKKRRQQKSKTRIRIE